MKTKDFHKSDELDRQTNPFNISISADKETGYVYSFNGVNTPGTPLGTGESFSFPARSSGRYVRFTPILDDDQWCSINEVTSLVLMLAVKLVVFELIWTWGYSRCLVKENPPFSDEERILE